MSLKTPENENKSKKSITNNNWNWTNIGKISIHSIVLDDEDFKGDAKHKTTKKWKKSIKTRRNQQKSCQNAQHTGKINKGEKKPKLFLWKKRIKNVW